MSDKPYPTVLELEKRIAALEARRDHNRWAMPTGPTDHSGGCDFKGFTAHGEDAKPQPVADSAIDAGFRRHIKKHTGADLPQPVADDAAWPECSMCGFPLGSNACTVCAPMSGAWGQIAALRAELAACQCKLTTAEQDPLFSTRMHLARILGLQGVPAAEELVAAAYKMKDELAAERERMEQAESARAIHFQMRERANARCAVLEGLLRRFKMRYCGDVNDLTEDIDAALGKDKP